MSTPAITPGEFVGSVVNYWLEHSHQLARRAQLLSAEELARQIAGPLGVSQPEAFLALTYVPDNLLGLLQSPDGWTALSAFVATQLGAHPPLYRPAVH